MARRFLIIFLILFSALSFASTPIKIGSKKFTESFLLAEMMAQLLENYEYKVIRNFGLAGTLVAYTALENGEIDIYPEYSGTISQVILKKPEVNELKLIRKELLSKNLDILKPFGFNNTYAIAVTQEVAQKYDLQKISQLSALELRVVFSYEFLNREDGWKNLKKIYSLNQLKVKAIEHELAYRALDNDEADVMDAYSTDGKIKHYNLVLLEDDKDFFPKYLALPFIRKDLPIDVVEKIQILLGKISNRKMTDLNSQVQNENKSYQKVAQQFLINQGFINPQKIKPTKKSWNWKNIFRRGKEHLFLTFTAIMMAILFAIPLGILLQQWPRLAEPIIGISGILQTIPSIALLAFMIPLFGIGVTPAIIGLFLYSILPILRNTYVALKNIPHQYLESARGIGLGPWETLYLVQIPMGLPVIIAGIRTATVINIGTATLAAFIGAGGLGEPIVTGLALNDNQIILQGAVPAACLAVVTEYFFSLWEKRLQKF
ncbi:MAG: ABC transporter permease subunit [Bdellovibrionales bacterium]|nr:ABC transporter permease subunit [Bdellovibrionales bacterium]